MTQVFSAMEPPAASRRDKDYLAPVRAEQLQTRVCLSQAELFFLSDLIAISDLIRSHLNKLGLVSKKIFVSARDQAFYKAMLFLLVTERVI